MIDYSDELKIWRAQEQSVREVAVKDLILIETAAVASLKGGVSTMWLG